MSVEKLKTKREEGDNWINNIQNTATYIDIQFDIVCITRKWKGFFFNQKSMLTCCYWFLDVCRLSTAEVPSLPPLFFTQVLSLRKKANFKVKIRWFHTEQEYF